MQAGRWCGKLGITRFQTTNTREGKGRWQEKVEEMQRREVGKGGKGKITDLAEEGREGRCVCSEAQAGRDPAKRSKARQKGKKACSKCSVQKVGIQRKKKTGRTQGKGNPEPCMGRRRKGIKRKDTEGWKAKEERVAVQQSARGKVGRRW